MAKNNKTRFFCFIHERSHVIRDKKISFGHALGLYSDNALCPKWVKVA